MTASQVLLFLKEYEERVMRSFVTGDVLLSDSIDFQCNRVLDMLLEWISDILVWREHNHKSLAQFLG